MDEQIGKTVWQGRIGDVPLRVDMLPSGRISSTWAIRGNERRATVDTIQQLEQRVLFQLLLGAGPDADAIAKQITARRDRGAGRSPRPDAGAREPQAAQASGPTSGPSALPPSALTRPRDARYGLSPAAARSVFDRPNAYPIA